MYEAQELISENNDLIYSSYDELSAEIDQRIELFRKKLEEREEIIKITVEKQTTIKINGVDKELVSKIAADIKNLKPVEPYKAKGIKEKGQFVLRKEGKKK